MFSICTPSTSFGPVQPFGDRSTIIGQRGRVVTLRLRASSCICWICSTARSEQAKKSPDIDADKSVSRQNEEQTLGYYGYPYYWGGAGLWGGGLYPHEMAPGYAG